MQVLVVEGYTVHFFLYAPLLDNGPDLISFELGWHYSDQGHLKIRYSGIKLCFPTAQSICRLELVFCQCRVYSGDMKTGIPLSHAAEPLPLMMSGVGMATCVKTLLH